MSSGIVKNRRLAKFSHGGHKLDSEADHVTVKSSQNCAINRTRRGAPETNGAGTGQGTYRDLFSICNASSPVVIKYEDILCNILKQCLFRWDVCCCTGE